jgi:hypothetical protein
MGRAHAVDGSFTWGMLWHQKVLHHRLRRPYRSVYEGSPVKARRCSCGTTWWWLP